jgi:hypothetical protein
MGNTGAGTGFDGSRLVAAGAVTGFVFGAGMGLVMATTAGALAGGFGSRRKSVSGFSLWKKLRFSGVGAGAVSTGGSPMISGEGVAGLGTTGAEVTPLSAGRITGASGTLTISGAGTGTLGGLVG